VTVPPSLTGIVPQSLAGAIERLRRDLQFKEHVEDMRLKLVMKLANKHLEKLLAEFEERRSKVDHAKS
jgi:hypothetical protein